MFCSEKSSLYFLSLIYPRVFFFFIIFRSFNEHFSAPIGFVLSPSFFFLLSSFPSFPFLSAHTSPPPWQGSDTVVEFGQDILADLSQTTVRWLPLWLCPAR